MYIYIYTHTYIHTHTHTHTHARTHCYTQNVCCLWLPGGYSVLLLQLPFPIWYLKFCIVKIRCRWFNSTSTDNWLILNFRPNSSQQSCSVRFCVSKSPPFNVTSLITVQLACNNTEAINSLHPDLICSLPTSSYIVTPGSFSSHRPNVVKNITTHYSFAESILRFWLYWVF